MFCPTCGAKNEDGGASCFVCGNPLPTNDRVAPQADSSRRTAERAGASRSPRQAERRVRPGSVGDRLIALVIDRLFLGAVLLIPLALVGRGWIATGLPLSPLWLNLLGGLALFVLIFVYHFALEKATGTTAGKIVMGLKVVNQGDREAMAAVALRNLLRVVDALFGYLVAPDVPVAVGRGPVRPCGLEPRVLCGSVVDDEVGDDASETSSRGRWSSSRRSGLARERPCSLRSWR